MARAPVVVACALVVMARLVRATRHRTTLVRASMARAPVVMACTTIVLARLVRATRHRTTPVRAPMTMPDEQDKLVQGVRLRNERVRRSQREGEPTIARRLGQIGVLGWIIVTPMLAGVFAGRWLDRTFVSGLFWTAPLLMLGAILGCWCAWRWMHNA